MNTNPFAKINISFHGGCYFLLINLFFVIFGNYSLANDENFQFSPDCAIKKEKRFVDIHIFIEHPDQAQSRILNILCDDLIGSNYCSAVLLKMDFLISGNIGDSVIKHIKKVRLHKISSNTAEIVWPGSHLRIDKKSGYVTWEKNGKITGSSCFSKKTIKNR